jgi:ABC-type uncharacterized transport system permease subunit
MSLLWLWVALGLYSLGLVHALLTVVQRRPAWFRSALIAFILGFLFHFVSLVEYGLQVGHFPTTNITEATSLFAFLITLGFLLVFWRYQVTSLSVFAFPVVFVMTLAAGLSQRPPGEVEPILKTTWVPLHVSFVLVGYTALFLACLGGLMYLLQESELKRHKPRAVYYRLPPLDTVDRVASTALAIYLLMVVARTSAGWRGHKAAVFSIFGLVMVLVSWAGNYLSTHHEFLGH